MRTLLPVLTLLLVVFGCQKQSRAPLPIVVELPRPNSGTFSFAQAEARKSEILSNAPTSKLEKWKNPYIGFCIHIGKDDSLMIYGHWMKGFPEYSNPRTNQSIIEIKKLADELPLAGNPAGILITSDQPLKDSKVIHEILNVLFIPSVQLFYARSSEPEGATNRSEPSPRSQTNSAPPAAGSPR